MEFQGKDYTVRPYSGNTHLHLASDAFDFLSDGRGVGAHFPDQTISNNAGNHKTRAGIMGFHSGGHQKANGHTRDISNSLITKGTR